MSNDIDNVTDEVDEVIVLTYEDGDSEEFEIVGLVTLEGVEYALMTPYDEDVDDDTEEEMEICIFARVWIDGEFGYSDDIDEATFEKVKALAEKQFAARDNEEAESDELYD